MIKASNKAENIRQLLIRDIHSGIFRENDQLPTEAELGKLYKTSRTTVRSALQELFRLQVIAKNGEKRPRVASRALAILSAERDVARERVIFLMPLSQRTNPMLEKIVRTVRERLPERYRLQVIFRDAPAWDELTGDDTVVIAGNYPPADAAKLRPDVKRLYSLADNIPGDQQFLPDNFAGGYDMGRYLLTHGHTRVLGLNFEYAPHSEFAYRLLGIRTAYAERNLEVRTVELPCALEQLPAFGIAGHLKHALTCEPECTAIFCLSDLMAAELYDVLHEFKLKIPDRISVISFDDQYYAQFLSPPLTTLKYPAESIGAKLAAAIIGESSDGSANMPVPPLFCVRESVKSLQSCVW